MQQQLEVLMTGHAWGQQAMLNQLGAIAQRRIQLQQQQSDKTALKVNRLGECSPANRTMSYPLN